MIYLTVGSAGHPSIPFKFSVRIRSLHHHSVSLLGRLIQVIQGPVVAFPCHPRSKMENPYWYNAWLFILCIQTRMWSYCVSRDSSPVFFSSGSEFISNWQVWDVLLFSSFVVNKGHFRQAVLSGVLSEFFQGNNNCLHVIFGETLLNRTRVTITTITTNIRTWQQGGPVIQLLTYSYVPPECWQNWVSVHVRIRHRHSAFVTEQLHFYKYCVSGPIYDHKGAFVLGGCCVFVCGSTSLLFVEAGLDSHCRKRQLGMCLGSVGSGLARCQTHRWPESQSLVFRWLSCSAHSQAPPLSFSFSSTTHTPTPHQPSSQMKTFPLVNRGRKGQGWGHDRFSEEYVTQWSWNAYGCEYAVEEALKTAAWLNKWAYLSITMPLLFCHHTACLLRVD